MASDPQIDKAIDAMLGEWKRSMLTFWALGLLLERPMYGLEIAREVERSTQGRMVMRPSTIYQLLRRLESKGLVASRWEQSTLGPPRAYYEATATGREVVRRYVQEVFAPGSPISAALGALMPRIMQQLGMSAPPAAPGKEKRHDKR